MSNRYDAPPISWRFNDADWKRAAGFWQLPHELVEEGCLRTLWRAPGGPVAVSLLPVLAVSNFPGKGKAGKASKAPRDHADKAGGWTGWVEINYRRIATQAGINPGSIRRAMACLVAHGLAKMRKEPRASRTGGDRVMYCLSSELFAGDGLDWAKFPARLIQSGLWGALPTKAARYLFLVIAALDPVCDEERMEQVFERHGDPDPEGTILAKRERAPLSLSDLVAASGLGREAVVAARRVLTTPLPGCDGGLVASGRIPNHPTLLWHAPNRGAFDARPFPLEVLNSPSRMRALGDAVWAVSRRSERVPPKRNAGQAVLRLVRGNAA